MYTELLNKLQTSKNEHDSKRLNFRQSLAPGRSIALASTNDGYCCEIGSLRYYLLCGIGGEYSKSC